MEIIKDAWVLVQSEAASYPAGVRIWMRVMALTFVSSILFAPWKNGARWIFLALAVNIMGLTAMKIAFPDLSRMVSGTIIHLLFWTLIVWMIWRPKARDKRKGAPVTVFNRIYTAWLIWASGLMAISLVLDAATALKLIF